MKNSIVSFKRLLFLIFVACTICLCSVSIRYFGYTDMGRQTITDWKDMPRQWQQIEDSNKQTDQYYQGSQTISGFDWNKSYSGTIIVPKVLMPELYQTSRIKIPLQDLYDYDFTGFVVRNTGTGILSVQVYAYTPGSNRLTFGESIMKGFKNNMVGELLGLYDYRWDQGPYSILGSISLPSIHSFNQYIQPIGKCVQFVNQNHQTVISSENILPGCVVQHYNDGDRNFFYQFDDTTKLYVMLSFFTYNNASTTEMSYSIEPMK